MLSCCQRPERKARVLVDVESVGRGRFRPVRVLNLPVVRDLRAGDDEDAGAGCQRVGAAHGGGFIAIGDRGGAGAVGRELVADADFLRRRRGGERERERDAARELVLRLLGDDRDRALGACGRRGDRRAGDARDGGKDCERDERYAAFSPHGCLQIRLDELVEVAVEDARWRRWSRSRCGGP